MSRKAVKRNPVDKAIWDRWLGEKKMYQKDIPVAVSRFLGIRPARDESWISHIVAGRRRLGLDEAEALASILEKPIEDVMVVFGVRTARAPRVK